MPNLDTELQEYRDSLPGRPSDFGYFGEHDDFDRWRYWPVVSNSRDADNLNRSNWEVVSKDVTERCPDGFITESSGHWAVGWVEQIRVDTESEEALGIAHEWHQRLDDYPVADEEHYSKLEHEEMEEGWESWAKPDLVREFEDDDELTTLLNLDEWGYADGFRDEHAEEFVKGIYEEQCAGNGNDPSFRDIVRHIRESLEFYKEEEQERRAQRRELGRAEYEKYQPTLAQASR